MDDIVDEDVLLFLVEQFNSLICFGECMVFKVLCKIFLGLYLEIEVGGYLICYGYFGIVLLFGEVWWVGVDGELYMLMILQGYLNNQGDVWNWILDNLE